MALAFPRTSAQIIPFPSAPASATHAGRTPSQPSHLRCKPGDRCQIVASGKGQAVSPNLGRVVVVVRRWQPGEAVSGIDDWITDGPAWVVVSVGDGLLHRKYVDDLPVGPYAKSMAMVMDDARLRPLKADEGGIEQPATRRMPRRRGRKPTEATPQEVRHV